MYDNIRLIRGGKHLSEGKYKHITREDVPSAELILVTNGVLYMFVGENRYSVSKGQVLRILPGERHGGYRESDGVEFIWLHLLGTDEYELPEVITSPVGFHRALLLSREALHYLESGDYPRECADNLIKVLLMELSHSEAALDSTVYSVKKLVREADGIITATECASRMGYSEDYLNRYFKERCGIGLKRYIDGVRLDKAKRLLLTENIPMKRLAVELGFSDYKGFLKFFKYHSSLTPMEYKSSLYMLKEN